MAAAAAAAGGETRGARCEADRAQGGRCWVKERRLAQQCRSASLTGLLQLCARECEGYGSKVFSVGVTQHALAAWHATGAGAAAPLLVSWRHLWLVLHLTQAACLSHCWWGPGLFLLQESPLLLLLLLLLTVCHW